MLGETLAELAPPRGACPRTSASRRPCCRSRASPARHAARARDEVHRRGHGRRRELPGRVRQGQAAAGSPLPTEGTFPLRVRPRQVGGHEPRRSACTPWASRSSPPGARPGAHEPRDAGELVNKVFRGRAATWSNLIESGEIDLVINTPDRPRGPHRRLRDPHRGARARASPASPRWPAPLRPCPRSRRLSGRA